MGCFLHRYILGYLVPAYSCFKALEQKQTDRTGEWCIYWCALSRDKGPDCLSAFERARLMDSRGAGSCWPFSQQQSGCCWTGWCSGEQPCSLLLFHCCNLLACYPSIRALGEPTVLLQDTSILRGQGLVHHILVAPKDQGRAVPLRGVRAAVPGRTRSHDRPVHAGGENLGLRPPGYALPEVRHPELAAYQAQSWTFVGSRAACTSKCRLTQRLQSTAHVAIAALQGFQQAKVPTSLFAGIEHPNSAAGGDPCSGLQVEEKRSSGGAEKRSPPKRSPSMARQRKAPVDDPPPHGRDAS